MNQPRIRTTIRTQAPKPVEGMRNIVFADNSSSALWLFRGAVLRRLLAAGFEVHVVAPYDTTTPTLIAAGVRFYEIRLEATGRRPAAEISLARQLLKTYRQIKPDLIFHYTIKLNIYGTFAARRLGIPSVTIVPGLGTFPDVTSSLLRRLLSSGYAYAATRARETWFLNAHDFGFFEARGWLTGTTPRILPGEGLDTSYYHPTPLPNAERPMVLSIGRLLETKGLRIFAEAARLARKAGLDYRFAVLGSLEESNPDAISEAELRGWIDEKLLVYLGHVADIRPYLAEAEMVVVPTHFREGLNRVILEAMSSGRPVITTPVPGAGELVNHRSTGYIVPVRNPLAVMEALAYHFALSPEERDRMGRRARQHIVPLYDTDLVIGHYFDVIASIAMEKNASA